MQITEDPAIFAEKDKWALVKSDLKAKTSPPSRERQGRAGWNGRLAGLAPTGLIHMSLLNIWVWHRSHWLGSLLLSRTDRSSMAFLWSCLMADSVVAKCIFYVLEECGESRL